MGRDQFDYSTINATELRKLKTYALPPSYRLQKDPGCGCHMDPPGFPTYFLQSVYTSTGNSPPRTAKADEVIAFEDKLYITSTPGWVAGDTWDTRHKKREQRMRRLWLPLPINHPRVIAWIRVCYLYFGGMYVPESGSTNSAKLEHSGPPERYRPFTYVREFYPEHELDVDLMTRRPERHEGDWWERESERPSPETCNPPSWLGRHPSSGSWCQHCGWNATK